MRWPEIPISYLKDCQSTQLLNTKYAKESTSSNDTTFIRAILQNSSTLVVNSQKVLN